MFKNKIAISKNFLIAICFISLLLFAITNVSAIDVNESYDCVSGTINEDNYGIDAIDEDKLGNSQNNILSLTVPLNGGTFSQIQSLINNNVSDGDKIELLGDFTSDGPGSHIIVYKNITFFSSAGSTLDGRNLSSIFVVETGGSGSKFINLNMKNGNSNFGGAMLIYGSDVTVDSCTFDSNYASRGGGAIYTDYNINQTSQNGRNLLIKNSKFINNFAITTAGAVGAYGVNTRILNCDFKSNKVYDKNGGAVYGGAIQVGKNEFSTNTLIKDCNFIDNHAVSRTGTGLSHGGASCLRDGVVYENCLFERNSADFGGALVAHHSGTINNCTFISNTANDYGGAIANMDDVTSMNLNIIGCDFDSNSAPYGGAAKLAGYSIKVIDSDFNDNYASIDGGALYIDTKTLDVYSSKFNQNSAEHDGGAVYVNGESTTIQNSEFISNVAIANPNVKNDGLGGAIYINGTSDTIKNNKFEYNVARNGSAVYYDKYGKDLTISNNIMNENQAWVYALPIYANDIYYGDEEKIGATIYGGNNIAKYNNLDVSNAIYNAASNTYIKVNDQIPRLGATDNGDLYQDPREYNIDILLTVKHSDGTVVYNKTLKSSYLGEVSDILTNLKPGTYTVTATHYEDNYYKAIVNQTTFKVIPQVDVEVNKATPATEYNYEDYVVWTITVANNGPNDATGVYVNDVLPDGLTLKSVTASKGTYSNGVWNIGNLTKSASATLKITTLIQKTGDITNTANVFANEEDWDLTNNEDSQKITVQKASDLALTKNVDKTNPNYGDIVTWTLKVTNNGPDIATNVVINDALPSGLTIKNNPDNYNNGKWSIGTLAVGESKTVEITTLVESTGTIVNSANAVCSQYDYNPSNNNATKSITVDKSCDLQISKSVNSTSPNYGDFVTWTLKVTNNGPDDASGVVVTDVLPAGLVYRSSSASAGSYSGGVWNIGNLANGKSATLNIVCNVSKTGSITNVASVKGNEFDVDESNNKDNASINVAKAADLEISKTVNNENPNYGSSITWTVTVRNNGPDDASGVVVSDVLPDGLIFQSFSSSAGSYSGGVWNIGSLANGGAATLHINCKINKTGTITNVASVKGNEFDIDKSNNKDDAYVNSEKSSDLSITKTVNDTNPRFNSLITWTVTVRNNGPDDASGVVVSDVLPDGLVYRSSSASAGSYSDGVWNIGNLANGKSATLNIVCNVSKTGSITNVASVKGNEFDVDESNNKDNASIIVAKSSDLEVSKSVNNTSPNYLDLITWTVTVRNNGPDVNYDIVLTDILPDGLILKSSTGNYINGRWTIGSLNNGESKSFELVTLVNKTGTITNIASAVGMEYDYNPSNNNASKSINVPKSSDLEISKSVNNTSPNYGDFVTWTLKVTNNGPDSDSKVVVSDVLPDGLIYFSSAASAGSYSNGVWNVGNLDNGKSATLNIVSKINKTGSIKNIAAVSGSNYDIDESNNKADASVNVAKAADLSITKKVNNTVPNYGDFVTWTITVSNNGPDKATGVNVTDVLPNGLIYQSHSVSQGNYNNGVWNIGDLSKGTSETLNIICKVAKTGSFTNNVDVVGNEYDINESNNKASKTINVAKAADLKIIKEANDTAPKYDAEVQWTITVINNGPDDASGVVVSDVLPDGLVYRSSSASAGSYSDGVWNIGSLANTKSVTLNIVCKVAKTGSITNVASVKGNEYDIDKSNNKDSAVIEVAKSSDLEVSKSVNNTSPNYGDLIKWTVTVRNNGPDIAHDIVLTDNLPYGLVFKSSTGNYINGRWTIDSLNVGQSKSFDVITLVNQTGKITNAVSAVGREYDHNSSNNNASKVINVPKAADLSVIKEINNTVPNYNDLIMWTVIVSNNGPDKATNVTVSDILPAGLIYQSYMATAGLYADGIWTVGDLTKKGSETLNIVCKVNRTGLIINIANVTGHEYDINKTNNNANSSADVSPASDLELIISVNNKTPNYHEYVNWTLLVKNNGPDDAHEVVVDCVLPEGLILKGNYTGYDGAKWNIGNLTAFSSVSLSLITFVNKTGISLINGSVSGFEYDYNLSNNDDDEDIIVPLSSDLEITKIVDNPNPQYMDNIKWIIIVKNNGPDKAENVNVNEVLSSAFQLISSNPSKGYYNNSIWKIGDLNNSEIATLEIITKVRKTGNFTNYVNVHGDQYDHNISNNDDNKSIIVNPAADIAVDKKVNNTSPNYNELVKWSVTVVNNGPDKANNLEIIDKLDKNLQFISYNATKGYYSDGLWKFCCLEPGESAKLDIITKVVGVGEIKNIVVANAKEYDFVPENNNDEITINVANASDLQITKMVNQSKVSYKQLVEWTLIVKNNGPSDATRVFVNDLLPEGLTFISAQGDGDYSAAGTWYIGDILSGQSKEIKIISRADKTGEFKNVAIVKGDQYDYDSSNNKDEKSIIVPAAADLSITKTVSKAQYVVGDEIVYNIEIINNGPDNAENISVSEIMDDSLEFKSFVLASGDYDKDNHVWHIKSLNNGEKSSLNISLLATKEGNVNNRVKVISDTFDHDLNNNFAETIVEIIKKIINPENPFNPGFYSEFEKNNIPSNDLNKIAKADIIMKESGLPVGLLILVSLISLALSNTKILKKR